jgi:hypothetical protein
MKIWIRMPKRKIGHQPAAAALGGLKLLATKEAFD